MFKSFIVIHLMIREGEPEVTLKYLAQDPHRRLAINTFTEGMLVGLFFLVNTWRLDMVIPSCEREPGQELQCAWASRLTTTGSWISTLYDGTNRHHSE